MTERSASLQEIGKAMADAGLVIIFVALIAACLGGAFVGTFALLEHLFGAVT